MDLSGINWYQVGNIIALIALGAMGGWKQHQRTRRRKQAAPLVDQAPFPAWIKKLLHQASPKTPTELLSAVTTLLTIFERRITELERSDMEKTSRIIELEQQLLEKDRLLEEKDTQIATLTDRIAGLEARIRELETGEQQRHA